MKDVSAKSHSSKEEETDTNPYLIARANRIAQIQQNLIQLGLAEPLVPSLNSNKLSEEEAD